MARFCDRVLFLEQGVARAVGPPDEVIGLYSEREPVCPSRRGYATGSRSL